MNKESTVEVQLTILSEDSSGVKSPVNINNLTGLVAVAYNEGKKIIGKYSMNPQTGFEPIDTTGTGTDAANGICIIRMNTDVTKASLSKMVKFEVHVFQANANFTGNEQHDIATDIELEEAKDIILINAKGS